MSKETIEETTVEPTVEHDEKMEPIKIEGFDDQAEQRGPDDDDNDDEYYDDCEEFDESQSERRIKVARSKAYVKVEVTKGRKRNVEVLKDDQYVFTPVPIQGSPEVISVSMGITVNLGNYESAKLEVFRSIPVSPDPVNADAAYEVIKRWIGQKIKDEVTEIRGEEVLDPTSKFIDEKKIF